MTSLHSATLFVLAAVVVACSPANEKKPDARMHARAASSDTVYQRRVADLARRARLVEMDSTARLFAAISRTPDSSLHVIRQALGCESMVGIRRHGAAAWQRAYRRMMDSLVATGFRYPADAERMEAAPGPPLEFRGPNSCGEQRYPAVADSLAREPIAGR